MKKFLFLALAAGIGGFIYGELVRPELDHRGKAKLLLDEAASAHDPGKLDLSVSSGSLVRACALADGTHAGLVDLTGGEKVKFWFRSHHLPPNISYARFDFSDGSRRYFEGYFCCEVMLPEDQIRTKADLLSFLEENQGKAP